VYRSYHSKRAKRNPLPPVKLVPRPGEGGLVVVPGLEPGTSFLSGKRSTAELYDRSETGGIRTHTRRLRTPVHVLCASVPEVAAGVEPA
jgi:hypothetical protein